MSFEHLKAKFRHPSKSPNRRSLLAALRPSTPGSPVPSSNESIRPNSADPISGGSVSDPPTSLTSLEPSNAQAPKKIVAKDGPEELWDRAFESFYKEHEKLAKRYLQVELTAYFNDKIR